MKSLLNFTIKILTFSLLSFFFLSLPLMAQNDGVIVDLPSEKEELNSYNLLGQSEEEGNLEEGLNSTTVDLPPEKEAIDITEDGNKKNVPEPLIIDDAAEKPEAPLPSASPAPDEGPVDAGPTLSSGKISEIDIQGNENIPEEEILALIDTKPGDIISTEALQRDLKAIYESGYFIDVKFEPEVIGDEVKIVFRVLENPVVKSIVFKGNELVSSEELLGIMKTRVGEIFNSNDFENDLKAINDYYSQELGMTGVPTHILELDNPELDSIVLTIMEGLKVTAIDFSGNTAVSSEELAEVISTQPGDYLNVLSINRDLANISMLYDEKYSLVLDEPLTAETSPEGVVTYIITEAIIEKIVLSGNTKTKDYVVFRELNIKEGDIINKTKLSDDIQKIYNLGYFEEVNVLPKPTGKPGRLILELQVKRG